MVPIVISNFDRCFFPSTRTSPFRPKYPCMQKPPKTATFLLEGNETRRVGGTDTGSAVLDRLATGGVSGDDDDDGAGFHVL